MKSEDVGFNFLSYLSRNQASWNEKLSTILISSDDKDSLIQFYSNFYRSLIHPNVVSDANGEYLGADFKIQKTTNERDQYSSFSVWDTYRTQAQLLAWLFPNQSSDMVQRLKNRGSAVIRGEHQLVPPEHGHHRHSSHHHGQRYQLAVPKSELPVAPGHKGDPDQHTHHKDLY